MRQTIAAAKLAKNGGLISRGLILLPIDLFNDKRGVLFAVRALFVDALALATVTVVANRMSDDAASETAARVCPS